MENAIRHGLPNGGTVILSTRVENDAYLITVADNGIGFNCSGTQEARKRNGIGLGNSVNIGAPYKRTNSELAAWSFINHISLLYFYGVVRALRENEMNDEYSPEDILAIGKNIYMVREYHGLPNFRLSEVPLKDVELLGRLGVKLPTE